MGLIITGHQRSGTSILQRVCNSHPDIVLTNEVGWYMFLNKPFKKHMQLILRRWLNKGNYPMRHSRYKITKRVKGLDFGRNLLLVMRYLVHLLQYQQDLVTANSVDRALESLFPGIRYVGDKYPDYWFKLDELARFSDLRCIVIYRDPRDMVNSVLIKSRGEWRDSWPSKLQHAAPVAQRWVRLIEKIEKNREKIYTIRYEEFVKNPDIISSGLASYLGVNPKGFYLADVNPKSIGKFRQGLSSNELSTVTKIAGEAMLRMGYEI